MPASGPPSVAAAFCLGCGERGLADVILNIVLFLPLGVALSRQGWSARSTLIACLLFAAGIEFAQLLLPGRSPTVRDAVTNGLGGWLGARAWTGFSRWDPRERRTPIAFLAVAVAATLCIAAGGWLRTPAPLRAGMLHGQWTPQLGQLERWRGRVLSAAIGSSSLSGGPIESASDVRSLLARGTPIRLTALAGTRTSGASPIFGLADSQGDHVLLLSQEGDAAVLHTRDLATALRLNARDVRIPAALAGVEVGDSLTLELEALRSPHPCLVVNGRRRCAPAPAAGSAWALLAFRESWSAHTYAALDALTLFALLVPVGFLLPTTPGAIRAAGLGLVGLGVPAAAAISGLAAPGALEVWGALGGLLVGWIAGRAWVSRATRRASR